jgi:hypothetical protein
MLTFDCGLVILLKRPTQKVLSICQQAEKGSEKTYTCRVIDFHVFGPAVCFEQHPAATD